MTDLFWEPGTLAGVRISVIDNFVSGDECDAIVARARPHMQAATHAGDNGELNHKSKARDSQQAEGRSEPRRWMETSIGYGGCTLELLALLMDVAQRAVPPAQPPS